MNSCLNRAYRLIWSELHCAWVAVAETVRGRGKASGRSARVQSAAFAVGLLGSSVALAQLPTGGQIVGGAGSISSTGTTMTVTQTTDRMAADWQSFSIGKGHTVNFVQPNSNSVALNRVLGSDVSVIQGALTANGKLFLINPNGVLFTPDAHVNVGAMVASTLNITTENFMAGNYRFEGASSNAIVNQGNITAHGDGAAGGTVALIAAKIVNQGSITAHKGNVLMGAGSRVTLNLGGPVSIEVEQGALDALIEQGGAIKADGGLVYLTAKAANDIVTTVINHTGITEAQTLATGERGEIYLMGDMERGRVQVAGTLDASAPNGGDGGFVETSAADVRIQQDTSVRTRAKNGTSGQWLIDPFDFVVAASGGNITGSALSTLLADNNITIQTANPEPTGTATTLVGSTGTNGDIFVNDSVTWTSGTTLTLNAHRNIEINASIDASVGDGGKLSLLYGQGAVASGNAATYTINASVLLKGGVLADQSDWSTANNFSTKLGNNGSVINYTVLNSQAALQAINTNNTSRGGIYALGSSLILVTPAAGSSNWTPIEEFYGRFDGLGNTVTNVTIVGNNDLGFFADTEGASIRDLTLDNISIVSTGRRVGGLAGQADNTSFTNVHVTGSSTVSSSYSLGAARLGGIIGLLFGSSMLAYSTSTANTAANGDMVGGVIGQTSSNAGTVTISNISSAGTVSGAKLVGGLIGYVLGAPVSEPLGGTNLSNSSYTGGSVSGIASVGGAVGYVGGRNVVLGSLQVIGSSVTATDSDSSGDGLGSGFSQAGGLVGSVYGNTIITDSLSTASVSGKGREIGGAVGYMADTSSLERVYATGNVTMTGTGTQGAVGGLVGAAIGTDGSNRVRIKDSYATGYVSVPMGGNSSGIRLGVAGIVGYADYTTLWNTYTTSLINGRTAAYTDGLLGHTSTPSQTGYSGKNFYDRTVNSNMSYTLYGRRTAELRYQETYEGSESNPGFDAAVWSFGAADSTTGGQNIAGYGASLPYLKNVTRTEDLPLQTTLFAGGWGGLSNDDQTGADGSAYGISTAEQLQNMSVLQGYGKPAYSFELNNNINLSGFAWEPYGDGEEEFRGHFDGQNFTISNLSINRPNRSYQGLFGYISNSTISNLELRDVSITGGNFVGALAGDFSAGSITNVYVGGGVLNGGMVVGGLVGKLENANATDTHSDLDVNALDPFSNSVGGLIGLAQSGALITNSYALSNVTVGDTANSIGGLVGYLDSSTITKSFANSAVTAGLAATYVGGLIGLFYGSGNTPTASSKVIDSYAIGPVMTGGFSNYIGGLIGGANDHYVSNTYSIGKITVGADSGLDIGGLLGFSGGGGVVNASYWNTETSELTVSAGGTGKTTAEMKNIATFAGWDIEDDQTLDSGNPYPRLTMANTVPVWKIKSVPLNNGGGSGGGDNGSPIDNAVANAQREAAREASRPGSGPTDPNPAALVPNPVPVVAVPQSNISLSGGLAFVQVNQPSADTGSAAGENASGPESIPRGAAGRDPSGFMRVFVVRGGLNLPPQASDTAQENTGANQGGAQ